MKRNEFLTEAEWFRIQLPVKMDGLNPAIDKQTMDWHYDVLYKKYIEKANDPKTSDSFQEGGAFLHGIFFAQLQKPKNNNKPTGYVLSFIEKNFKSWDNFVKEWEEVCEDTRGSQWVVLMDSGKIEVIEKHKVKKGIVLINDFFEHAYYFQYGPDKKKYIKNFWKVINWDVVEIRLEGVDV